MKNRLRATVSVSSPGRLVIGVPAPCGCCLFEHELTEAELRAFVAELKVCVRIGKRVRALPLPWIHEEGQA